MSGRQVIAGYNGKERNLQVVLNNTWHSTHFLEMLHTMGTIGMGAAYIAYTVMES